MSPLNIIVHSQQICSEVIYISYIFSDVRYLYIFVIWYAKMYILTLFFCFSG